MRAFERARKNSSSSFRQFLRARALIRAEWAVDGHLLGIRRLERNARARFCYDDEPLLVGHYKLLNRETSILPPPLLPDFTPFFGLPFSVWFFFSLFSILERVAFFKDVSPFLLIISGNSFLFDNFFSTNLRWIRIERVYASTTCWNLNYSVSLL